MTFRALFCLVVAGLALTACDGKQADQSKDARGFIVGRTTPVDVVANIPGMTTHQTWTLVAPNWDGQWRWTEKLVVTITVTPGLEGQIAPIKSGVPSVKTETYAVDPRELAWPAEAMESGGHWNVGFECFTADCIAVTDSAKGTTVQRSQNFWWYSDRETAQRVAVALTTLLKARGAREKPFTAPPAQAATSTVNASPGAGAATEDESAVQQAESPRSSATRNCKPGSSSYETVGSSGVICGCDYTSYATSVDGSSVCAGGLYTSYATSNDGRDVACGGEYTSYATSNNGHRVCAGGRYTSYATSNDGKDVACGGLYSSYATSNDGHRVCAGGLYTSYATSNDGTNVACGGEYTSYATSNNGHRVCAGGRYTSYATSNDGTDVACGGLYTSYATSNDGARRCYGGRYGG